MSADPTVRATARRRRSRAYIPIALLVVAQGLYIAAAPSVGVGRSSLKSLSGINAEGRSSGNSGVDGGVDGGVGNQSPSGDTPTFADGTPKPGSAANAAGRKGSVGSGAPGAPGADAVKGGDTSHCTPGPFAPAGPGGRQHNKFTYVQEAPACVPKWPAGADNGGATYSGVTGKSVKIVIMEEQPNEQIDAILGAQGLATSEEDRQRVHKYGSSFLNTFYERYGRNLDFVRFKSKCPITPPSVVVCKEEARKIIALKPFAVIFALPVYPEVFDEFTRAGIISFGGWNFADSYFTDSRPFRYDVFMTGTKAAKHFVEYYCKKLARKPASNSGNVIHPQIGSRGIPRKLGILVNESPPLADSARFIAREVAKCENNRYTPEVHTFVGDLDRAAETTEAVTAKMINTKTTSVMCWCGPLEMTGFSKSFTSQGYYPEHVLPGIAFSDADAFGRLYDPAQWIHAFGPSHIADSRPTTEYQSYAAYKFAGDPDHHVIGVLSYFLYMDLAAQAVHYAGPTLNPVTFERGLLSSKGTGGGNPKSILWDWSPGDYGGYADVREVWYDPTLDSEFDGQKGGYRVLNNHRRFNLGEWNTAFEVPVAAA